jgi:hypothetical protein
VVRFPFFPLPPSRSPSTSSTFRFIFICRLAPNPEASLLRTHRNYDILRPELASCSRPPMSRATCCTTHVALSNTCLRVHR